MKQRVGVRWMKRDETNYTVFAQLTEEELADPDCEPDAAHVTLPVMGILEYFIVVMGENAPIFRTGAVAPPMGCAESNIVYAGVQIDQKGDAGFYKFVMDNFGKLL